jgi:hypothetical protein
VLATPKDIGHKAAEVRNQSPARDPIVVGLES